MKRYLVKSAPFIALLGCAAIWLFYQHIGPTGPDETCVQKICPNDKLPEYDSNLQALFKIDGKFYTAPKQYGGFAGVLSFFWPSRAPAERADLALELRQSKPGLVSNFPDVAIQIFIRSPSAYGVPPSVRGFAFIEQATTKGWVEDKSTIRPDLDEYTMKHIQGLDGYYIDSVHYYVATALSGTDGFPPVAACGYLRKDDNGGSGFMWNGLWVGIRMNQKHCTDWPQIYSEVMSVLNLVKEIQ